MSHYDVNERDLERTNRYLSDVKDRANDFRPVFRWAQRALEIANRTNFGTAGATSGRPWMPLDAEYAFWKLEHYGPLPMLVRTGDLYKSVAFLEGPPNKIARKEAMFGTKIPYAKFHQFGTRKMPMRKIIFTPKGFAAEFSRRAANWVVHGNMEGLTSSVATSALRRTFS